MALRYTHTRLLVDDYYACFLFYRDIMGLHAVFGDEASGYADFDTGNVSLALFDRREMAEALESDAAGSRGFDRLALIFAVDDVDQTTSALQEKGVRFVTPPADHPDWGIRTAHFRDPDGNLIEIYTPLARS